MNFLFHTTVFDQGMKLDYNVFEFKLAPGKYKAELISPDDNTHIREVIFWKENEAWKTKPPLKSAKQLAEILGSDIEHMKN